MDFPGEKGAEQLQRKVELVYLTPVMHILITETLKSVYSRTQAQTRLGIVVRQTPRCSLISNIQPHTVESLYMDHSSSLKQQWLHVIDCFLGERAHENSLHKTFLVNEHLKNEL